MKVPLGRMRDLTGQVFGQLTAIRPVGKDASNNVIWEFRCLCGNLHTCRGSHAVAEAKNQTNPLVPSCGYVSTPHGLHEHPIYSVWNSMIQRCYNQADKSYPLYGAKGITVCPAWRHDVSAFIAWATANGWEKGMQLDKDVLSDSQNTVRVYSPETCQFISAKENSSYSSRRENHLHNRRIKLNPIDASEIKRLYDEEGKSMRDIAKLYNVTQPGIRYVISSGDLLMGVTP